MSIDKNSPGPGGGHAGRQAEEPYDLIKDPAQIIRFIEKALVDEENVEVTINDRTRLYFSYFMDHLPNALEETDAQAGDMSAGEGASTLKTVTYPPYTPLSYLREKNRLIIAPLSPAMGNALIRSSRDVDLRFFQGVKSLEFTVRFDNTLIMRGEPVIQLSFPKEMRLIRKRRHYRAPYSDEVELEVFIRKEGTPVSKVRLVDISVGGLGFCNASPDPEAYVVGGVVTVDIRMPESEPIVMNAFIRNAGRAGTKDGCKRNEGKVGLQFDVPNETAAMRVEEVVAYVQREHLQVIQERKAVAKAPAFRGDAPGDEKRNLAGELGKFLGLKKKWNFT